MANSHLGPVFHLRSPDPEATCRLAENILGGAIAAAPGRIDVKLRRAPMCSSRRSRQRRRQHGPPGGRPNQGLVISD